MSIHADHAESELFISEHDFVQDIISFLGRNDITVKQRQYWVKIAKYVDPLGEYL